MALPSQTVPLSTRIPSEISELLDQLSDSTGRTRSFLASEAIKNYLEIQSWQISGIKKALEKANKNDVTFVSHDKIKDWLTSWGTKQEKGKPKCK